jgi:hypothetical protein
VADNINIEVYFNFNAFEQWGFELREGWPILVVAIFASIILAVIFLFLLRCCAVPIIWLFIVIGVLSMLLIGIYFILTARGVVISTFLEANLSQFSFDSMLTVGIILIGVAVLMGLIVICLSSRITMGANAVKLGSVFLVENCCLVILPITQAFVVIAILVGLIAGAVSLYARGTFTFNNYSAFPDVTLDSTFIALTIVFIATSIWLIFFVHGCNQFLLCSAVSIWYFNNSSDATGAPCGDSIWRLLRYHLGSVTFAGVLNGMLFVIKILANLFSFDSQDDDGALVACCLKCLSYIFCVFKL